MTCPARHCLAALALLAALGPDLHAQPARDLAAQTTPGILHEDITVTERAPLALRPLPALGAAPSAHEPERAAGAAPPAVQNDHLIDHMDVYALSSHARFLALPRMVQPLFVRESIQGRAHMPTTAEWRPIIDQGSRCSGLDPRLIRAVITVESGNNPEAVSPVGAQGLMQLMPATQAYLGVTDPFDPAANVRAGSMYLREQLDAFGTLELALAAYNAGPGSVRRHGGIPPFDETKNFVRRVLVLYHEADREKTP